MNSKSKFWLGLKAHRPAKRASTGSLRAHPHLTFIFLLLLSPASAVEINWYTIDGGGGISNAGDIRLIGVIGQHDTVRMTGANRSLSGGYLPLPPDTELLFKDSYE